MTGFPDGERVAASWIARLPASKEEGQKVGFDGRVWLAGYLEEFARDRAETVFLDLHSFMGPGRTLEDLARYIESRGMVVMEAWASLMATTGTDREPWAAEAANRAAHGYRERIDELLKSASLGGCA